MQCIGGHKMRRYSGRAAAADMGWSAPRVFGRSRQGHNDCWAKEAPSADLALVHESPSLPGDSMVVALARLGWRVRTMARDLAPMLTVSADLWAVNLPKLYSCAGTTLRTIGQMRPSVPLLLVADEAQPHGYAREIDMLRSVPSLELELLMPPYSDAELRI